MSGDTGRAICAITAEASQAHSATLRSRGAELGADVRVRLEIGDPIFAADYIKAQRIRAKMRMEFSEVLHDRDAIVMPTILATAPALTDTLVEASGQQFPMHAAMTRLTAPYNSIGMPAITIPCGATSDGVPTAIQLAGSPGSDYALLMPFSPFRHSPKDGQSAGLSSF